MSVWFQSAAMIRSVDVVLVLSWIVTLGLVSASWMLERRYVPLRRRETERILAMYGYYRIPLITRILGACMYRRILWLGPINAGWLVLWWLRCYDRRTTFALEPHGRAIVPLIGALVSTISVASIALDCRTGELIVASVFALAWVCTTLVSYALEARIPCPHREREMVVTVGAIILAHACIVPFLADPWNDVFASVAQLLASARLLVPDIRRAIARSEAIDFYEAIYEGGAPVYSAREALSTPLEAPFLSYCKGRDPDIVNVYQGAIDRKGGAEIDGPHMDPREAARPLEHHWPGFIAHRATVSASRTFYALEEESDSEDEREEEEAQYVDFSEMREIE